MGLFLFLTAMILIAVGISYLCWRMVFFVPREKISDAHILPEGRQYKLLSDTIHPMIDAVTKLNYEDVFVQYEDRLRLHGKYYHISDDAPIEILFHGYQSIAERDFCGGLQLALNSGHNAILVDQRAHGQSQGKCLAFGILERYDCVAWVNYAVQRFGPDCKIILAGISMGATTVLMAGGLELPKNVVGIVADCGYSSPADIIKKVMADRQVPVAPVYPFIRLGGRLFGGFDIEAESAEHALTGCRIPVLFLHGENDRFVPCDMSRRNYWATAGKKTLATFPGAGHGLSYMVDPERYKKAVADFHREILAADKSE